MAFKELLELDANTTIAIGGVNRKTGKKNPTSAEGYYLGSREVPSTKSKTGKCWIHYLSTDEGNLGVWGKTNMDKKIVQVPTGTMVRITFTGMKPSKNGDMYVYSVALDKENTIDMEAEFGGNPRNETSFGLFESGDGEEEDVDGGDDYEETPVAATLSAEQKKAKVQAILNRNKSKGA